MPVLLATGNKQNLTVLNFSAPTEAAQAPSSCLVNNEDQLPAKQKEKSGKVKPDATFTKSSQSQS